MIETFCSKYRIISKIIKGIMPNTNQHTEKFAKILGKKNICFNLFDSHKPISWKLLCRLLKECGNATSTFPVIKGGSRHAYQGVFDIRQSFYYIFLSCWMSVASLCQQGNWFLHHYEHRSRVCLESRANIIQYHSTIENIRDAFESCLSDIKLHRSAKQSLLS